MPKQKDDQPVEFKPDELRIPMIIINDRDLQSLDCLVYGVVFWLERLKDGRCWASNGTIGNVIGASAGGVANGLTRLREKGYIECAYDAKGCRTSIKTLVYYSVNPSSNDEGGVHQMMNIDKKKKEEHTSETLAEIDKVYRAWLIYMVIGPDRDPDATTDERETLIASAAKRYRLTDKRKSQIAVRLRDAGAPMIIKAIKNIGNSPFHRGENDREWSADIEFLLRNYEQVEKWANK